MLALAQVSWKHSNTGELTSKCLRQQPKLQDTSTRPSAVGGHRPLLFSRVPAEVATGSGNEARTKLDRWPEHSPLQLGDGGQARCHLHQHPKTTSRVYLFSKKYANAASSQVPSCPHSCQGLKAACLCPWLGRACLHLRQFRSEEICHRC